MVALLHMKNFLVLGIRRRLSCFFRFNSAHGILRRFFAFRRLAALVGFLRLEVIWRDLGSDVSRGHLGRPSIASRGLVVSVGLHLLARARLYTSQPQSASQVLLFLNK